MEECIFCKIVAGEIPTNKVYEDENSLAFLDVNPRNPGHTLVIPKKHYETILNVPDNEIGELFKVVKKVAAGVKKATNADGISISQSNFRAAGQVVPHVHFHVIPRFNNEGPVGLEGILTIKRLNEESMKKIAESIKNSVSTPTEEEHKKETKEEEIDFNF